MDETAAWLDMVENTNVNATGAKDMPQNLTGNEVFQGAKREASSSSNGSMKEKFTLLYSKRTIGSFSPKRAF